MKEREKEKKGGEEERDCLGIPQKMTEIHIVVFKIPK